MFENKIIHKHEQIPNGWYKTGWEDNDSIMIRKNLDANELAELNKKTAQLNWLSDKEYKILNLKQQLSSMDYKTSKRTDGEYTENEWAAIVAERKRLRNEIRQLENESTEL